MNKKHMQYIVAENCYRTDGFIKANAIHKSYWIKLNLLTEYEFLVSCCAHPGAKIAQILCHFLNDLPVYNKCAHPNCNNLAKWDKQTSLYLQTCSKQCSSSLPSKIEKWKATNFEKYGDGNYGQATENALSQRKHSCLTKYGVDSYSRTEQHIKMMKQDNPLYKQENVNKLKQTMQRKYGTDYFRSSLITSKDIIKDPIEFIKGVESSSSNNYATNNNIDGNTVRKYLQIYGREDLIGSLIVPATGPSRPELMLSLILDDLQVVYHTNTRQIITPLELDFYLPDHKLAIEVNGIYWHSSASPGARDKNYHFDKWEQCRAQGITLLSYTDHEVNTGADKIKSKIKYMISNNTTVIGARKCTIGTVTKQAEFELLTRCHVQGKLLSRTGSLGAYHDDELVAVINWAQRKKYLEITRYACDTDNNTSYPGLFSRLTRAMITELNYIGDIVSFSNNDHSNGNVYRQSGFTEDKILGPAYWYTRDFVILENRQKYMKSKIAKQFGIDMTHKTEQQAMQELGYHRYYDSGKIRWKLSV